MRRSTSPGVGPFVRAASFVVALVTAAAVTAAAQGPAKVPQPLPPISTTCPMHPEVVDNRGGRCPICSMNLVPVRLALVWSCPIHMEEVSSLEPGRCKICGRELVRVVKALTWTCRAHPQINEINPGVCPIDKRPLVPKYSLRPHGDHNPKHGGLFVMAPNNWHVEGTHPAASVFRLYVYDEYSKPFVPAEFSGRLIVSTPGAGGRGGAGRPQPAATEISLPLKRAGKNPYLEVRVPQLALPANVAVKVRFHAKDPEYRFDFPFNEYSKEPAVGLPAARGKK
jgi:hypothetical protein